LELEFRQRIQISHHPQLCSSYRRHGGHDRRSPAERDGSKAILATIRQCLDGNG
jgi:hypothetical protein